MNDAARAHERGLDPVRRKRDGVFYTPAPLVDRLVGDALGRVLAAATTVRVVDPACGAGAFLIAAARTLLDRGEQMARETGAAWGAEERLALLRASIFGVDVDPAAAVLARAAVAELAGAVPEDMSENIKVGNALLGADAPAEAGPPFVWAAEFPAAAGASTRCSATRPTSTPRR
ncbi:N-6 DNA methylase [Nannocystis pusilla]|uniref:N-6 DNA methylase n=1 Tax=Nannocystis pusilla TaxID=889268 RepID=UPI003B7EBCDB